jgi:hypothetical protein
VGESDAGYAAALADWELTAYRERLENRLAQAELSGGSLPREELQAQLATVLAEQTEREQVGSADAQP